MGTIIILLTALLPIAILVYHIYRKDKKSPDPTGQLVKAFLWGILSVPLSFCISLPLGLIGVYSAEATSIWEVSVLHSLELRYQKKSQNLLCCGCCYERTIALMRKWMALSMQSVSRWVSRH